MRFNRYNQNTNEEEEVEIVDTLQFQWGGTTDEGYHYYSQKYTLIGDTLYMEILEEFSDCDGPGSSYRRYKHIYFEDGFPIWWEKIDSYNRDVFAERQGY